MPHTPTPTRGGTTDTLDPYMAPTEVAEVLSVSREYAGRLMRTGVIPDVVDLSSAGERATLRVRRSALRAWIASRAL